MKYMKHILSLIIILCWHIHAYPKSNILYTPKDSITVIELLSSCIKENQTQNKCLMFFAKKLKSHPYVGKTLENGSHERLVINLRQLDCTTYIENVLALYMCIKSKKISFRDFCNYLKYIRYEDNKVTYATRLHYFSYWIEQNERKGIVKEIISSNPSILKRSLYEIYYMSHNPEKYPALTEDSSLVRNIADMERKFDGKSYIYIPKEKLKYPELLKSTIKDGDIIAIVTNKKGLDISHIGFAVWHRGNIHLLNASSTHKKVIEEPMTLYQYMMRHPSQIGIRIVRVV